LKLAAFTDKAVYRDAAEKALRTISEPALRYPMGFARWLCAADFAFDNGRQVAVVFNEKDENTQELIRLIQGEYRPNMIVAACSYPPPQDAPALLMDRPLKENKATVYVCEHFVCKQPVNSVEELRQLL